MPSVGAKQTVTMIFNPKHRPAGLLLLGLSLLTVVPGCRNSRSGSDDVHVRLINAVPDAGSLTVAVDGQRVWKRALFRSNTGYQGIADGAYGVRVEAENFGGTLLTNRPLSFEKGHFYTVLALGRMRNVGTPAQVEVMEDDAAGGVPDGKTGLRLINASPEGKALDLVVRKIVGLKSVAYGRRSDMLLLDSGSYDLKIAAADTPDVLAGPINLSLEAGHVYTLVAMGQASDQTLSLEAYSDAR